MGKLGMCHEDFCCVNEELCVKLVIPGHKRSHGHEESHGHEGCKNEFVASVWTNKSHLCINGTILVTNKGTCDNDQGITVELIVNGKEKFNVKPGETKAFTFQNLQSIVIREKSGVGQTNVDVSFTLNYKF
ncbi:S-Ena type endospore appendage [Sporosarcina sp. G11-34]|uniref:S-Ena type endospore appendage n=1 Tax=Sporosarcina sp. G11-34 TaxID=2849605 RepID=UPI0022A91532|nr:S-Ena type endospore appendage [Sporosarcina sp. G11-34]MCZ2259928.1 DUF3992 domain-containing protein [Sporosarcina sp. G11-34]